MADMVALIYEALLIYDFVSLPFGDRRNGAIEIIQKNMMDDKDTEKKEEEKKDPQVPAKPVEKK
jgi:hypothetical protein